MARMAQALEPGAAHHVFPRGNRRQPPSFSGQITIAPGVNTFVLTVNYNSPGIVNIHRLANFSTHIVSRVGHL